jgi:hypothetical protein
VFGLDPVALDVGNAKADAASAVWVRCMQSGEWPAYPPEVEWILPPPWIVQQWENARHHFRQPRENAELLANMVRAGNLGG